MILVNQNIFKNYLKGSSNHSYEKALVKLVGQSQG